MNRTKKIAIALVAIVILVVGLLVFLSSNIGSLIVDAVESFGPKVTQSRVTLDSADVAISGEGELNGLVVGNPAGYKSEDAFRLGSIKVSLDPESLTTDVIHIRSVQIIAPSISYEPGGDAGSNLNQLVKNVQQFSGGKGEEKETGGEEKRLIIDLLTISQGEVSIVTPLSETPVSSSLPEIELRDIGKNSGGASASEVVKQVMQKVVGAASRVGDVSLDKLKSELGSKVGDKLKSVQEKAGTTDGIGDKAGEVGDKLKSMFQ